MSTPAIGVNYTPSVDWMFQWYDIDANVVRADFEAIAALGLDHVRVFPLWPVLQPNRTLIRTAAVEDVAAVVQIGADLGLTVYVDVVQGHMSGFDFVPAWLLNWHRGNMFTDAGAVEAQARLVSVLYERLADEPGFGGLTLGNETNQFVSDPNPDKMPATVAEVSSWLERTIGAVQPRAEHTIAHSTNDHVWYRDEHPFVPRHVTEHGSVSTVHSWIFNGTAARYGALSPQSVRHGEYLIELARAFATTADRQIWLQEIGAPDSCLTEQEIPEFAEQALRAAFTTQHLYGVTWWCSHDIGSELSDFKPLEYGLGLLRPDQSVKPIGARLRETISDLRSTPPTPPARTVAIEIATDAHGLPASRASLAPGGAVFEAWHGAVDEPATLLTSSAAGDPAELARRGIVTVRRPEPTR